MAAANPRRESRFLVRPINGLTNVLGQTVNGC